MFRQQVLTEISSKQYGTIILAKPLSHQILTALFVMIALAIVAFFILFSTTRKAQTSGVLLPSLGIIRVTPSQTGILTKKLVKDGQSVKAGEIMFVLRIEKHGLNNTNTKQTTNVIDAQKTISTLLKSRRDSFDTEMQQLNIQIKNRRSVLQKRLEEIAEETTRISSQITLQEQRTILSEQNLKRFKDLQITNFISPSQVQDKQAELIDQQQRLAELHRLRISKQREQTSTQAELNDAHLIYQRERNTLQRNASVIDQDIAENETRREFVITAPQDGTVATMTVELGQTVQPNQMLASILPAGSMLEAEIYAPSRSIGFVKPGMKVLLRYQAYPYQKFGQFSATVREIASTALRPEDLALPGVSSNGGNEPVFRIRLSLDSQNVVAYGKTLPLKSGMLMDASIVLEKRYLYEWILEPLFSISGRI